MPTRKEIIEKARSLIGIPFVHQGRIRAGCDCAGVLVIMAQELGVEHWDVTNYGKTATRLRLLKKVLDDQCIHVPVSKAKPGDIVIAEFERSLHSGVLTDKGIVHASNQYKGVREHRINPNWHIRYAYLFPMVEDI